MAAVSTDKWKHYMPIAERMCGRMFKRYGSYLERGDILAALHEGMLKGLARSNGGPSEETYVVYKMRNAVMDALRGLDFISIYGRRKERDTGIPACQGFVQVQEDRDEATERHSAFSPPPPIEDMIDRATALAVLPPREQGMYLMRAKGYTGVEVGKAYGVTESRVSQILTGMSGCVSG
jgi:RNA polymerase sigma factor (sigma-70 family)